MMAGNLIAALTTIPIFALMWGYTPAGGNYQPVVLVLLVFILVLYVTMVYGPIAAFLVESFPARVRYTSVSLPYHVGNGYFGGFLPLIAGVDGRHCHAQSRRLSRRSPVCRPALPDCRRGHHLRHRDVAVTGNTAKCDWRRGARSRHRRERIRSC